MADDDGPRRPPQAYAIVSPAGVGATTTNQVLPGVLQEIFDTGDQSLIDQALDQLTTDDLTRYLQSLPPLPMRVGCPRAEWAVKLPEPLQPDYPSGYL